MAWDGLRLHASFEKATSSAASTSLMMMFLGYLAVILGPSHWSSSIHSSFVVLLWSQPPCTFCLTWVPCWLFSFPIFVLSSLSP